MTIDVRTRRVYEEPSEGDGVRVLTGEGPATIVFASREERFNNATALVEYLSRGAGSS